MSVDQSHSQKPAIAILHYSAPPVVGGVESVITAHGQVFHKAGYPVTVIAGRGGAVSEKHASSQSDLQAVDLPVRFLRISEMDSQHPEVLALNRSLEAGTIPEGFEALVSRLVSALDPLLTRFGAVIVHNIFSKHFNLPLTAALMRLLEAGRLPGCIAWCHDLTWTSPNSRRQVHQGYPWDLLRTYNPEITYVTVSEDRRQELVDLLGCQPYVVQVIYNGVNLQELIGIRPESWSLAERLGMPEAGLVLLMPVRVTQAKNIEYALQVTEVLKQLGLRPLLVVTGPPDPHEAGGMAYFHSLLEKREQLHLAGEARFVYESCPDPSEPCLIENEVVGDLLRLSDVVFIPSHREGFGMPVLEAGLAGIPVVSTSVPAALEIGGKDVLLFDGQQPAEITANQIRSCIESSAIAHLRSRVRRDYTWEAIFKREIEPLVAEITRNSPRSVENS